MPPPPLCERRQKLPSKQLVAAEEQGQKNVAAENKAAKASPQRPAQQPCAGCNGHVLASRLAAQ
jgi:hypothetical protein